MTGSPGLSLNLPFHRQPEPSPVCGTPGWEEQSDHHPYAKANSGSQAADPFARHRPADTVAGSYEQQLEAGRL